MKKIFFIFIILIISLDCFADFQDYQWSINYGEYKEDLSWHAVTGKWKLYKTIYLNDGFAYNRRGQIIGSYWFVRYASLHIKIDVPEVKFYGSIKLAESASIICGIGYIWKGSDVRFIKIIMVRREPLK